MTKENRILQPEGDSQQAPILTAYCVNSTLKMPLVPAASDRAWMDATNDRFANRCLPLLIGNQAGWFLLTDHQVEVVWTGGNDIDSLRIKVLSGDAPYPALSHFGHGILTWSVPYLFRTPPGYNLLVRGPANLPKDGIYPLDGVVESDWSDATFTMNWKMTRAWTPVTFEVGEPIAMILPQRRGELEGFQPEIRAIETAPEIRSGYRKWSDSRRQFNAALSQPASKAQQQGWQRDYFRGASPSGERPPEHQTKLVLKDFVDRRSDPA